MLLGELLCSGRASHHHEEESETPQVLRWEVFILHSSPSPLSLSLQAEEHSTPKIWSLGLQIIVIFRVSSGLIFSENYFSIGGGKEILWTPARTLLIVRKHLFPVNCHFFYILHL